MPRRAPTTAKADSKQRAPLRPDDPRPNSAQRGYDNRWRRYRDAYVKRHPLCVHCLQQGRTTATALVDHIKPIADGGARLDDSNLQALCRACHAVKTADDIKARRGSR